MSTSPQTQSQRIRDPRLDFYRGLAMFIIFIAHTPGNWFSNWIPARFGLSDAAEVFVFCSGMASAVAFGGTFHRRGWLLGTARIVQRVWQIYWAHISTFFLTAMMLAAIDLTGAFDTVYIGTLNLWKFFEVTQQQLVGLFTLTYVPNFFDILPMYMVVLAMVPIVMALSRISPWLVAVMVATLWFLAQSRILDALGLAAIQLDLPAEPWSDRNWFFNPFGWQLIFFTGFAFMIGWLPKPPVNIALIAVAIVVVAIGVSISVFAIRILDFDWVGPWRTENRLWITKTDQGILRYIHFLALAYLAWIVAGENGKHLRITGDGPIAKAIKPLMAVILKVGQQSLAVFLASIVLSRFGGFVLDQLGNGYPSTYLVNFTGFALLIATAYIAAWFKQQPWRGSATG